MINQNISLTSKCIVKSVQIDTFFSWTHKLIEKDLIYPLVADEIQTEIDF